MRTTHRSREKMFRSALSLTIVSLFLVFTSCTGLFAQTIYNWNPLSTNFGSSFNWSPGGGPPGELDTAVFSTGATSTVTFNYSPFNAALQHQSGNTIFRPSGTNVTYTLNGASSISGGSLTINPDGIFKLDVRFSGLTLSGNSTFNINAGEVSNGGVLNVGSGTAGTINVDGSTASFTSSHGGQNTLGFAGGTGTLVFSNGATGTMAGSLRIGGGPSAGGYLSVYGGSTFSFGAGNVGNGTTAGQEGRIVVDGNGSIITQTGSSTLNLGKAASNGVQAVIRAENGGTYNTGTGLTSVNATGEVLISGGTFNANGNVNVFGGSITRTSGNFNLASGRTLTASNDAQINLGGTNALSGGTTWNIISGADLSSTGAMHIGTSGGVTAVTIDGAGSSLTTSAGLFIGSSGHGMLNIQGGGTVANTIGIIGNNANSTGEVMVSGSGSQWNNSNILEVGTSGHGTLSIQAGGIVSNTFGYIG